MACTKQDATLLSMFAPSASQVLSMKDNSKAAQAQQEAMARLHARVEELSRQVTQLEAGKRTLEKEKADLSKQLVEEREEREKMEEQVGDVEWEQWCCRALLLAHLLAKPLIMIQDYASLCACKGACACCAVLNLIWLTVTSYQEMQIATLLCLVVPVLN